MGDSGLTAGPSGTPGSSSLTRSKAVVTAIASTEDGPVILTSL